MTVMCPAITCKFNSKHNSKQLENTCTLEVVVLQDMEREDYADDFMACALYKRGDRENAKENRECAKAHA